MRKSRFSDSQIMALLKKAESGVPVAEICRDEGISTALERLKAEIVQGQSEKKWCAISAKRDGTPLRRRTRRQHSTGVSRISHQRNVLPVFAEAVR